jgi:hypothetical protein
MANTFEKSKLQNLIIETNRLPIGICFPKQVCARNHNRKKVAKKPNQPQGGYL